MKLTIKTMRAINKEAKQRYKSKIEQEVFAFGAR